MRKQQQTLSKRGKKIPSTQKKISQHLKQNAHLIYPLAAVIFLVSSVIFSPQSATDTVGVPTDTLSTTFFSTPHPRNSLTLPEVASTTTIAVISLGSLFLASSIALASLKRPIRQNKPH
ncbi:MAG: hypothetical protein LBI43_03115 [Streptococcaceae bacterium]|jgi:hypothetical protein|nr:hypothetical protein [Streptococcaceae bacterium]